jgi:phosphoacetylglucosamine mutase
MLHHVVLHANPQYLPLLIPPRPNLQGYYDLLADSYHALLLTGTPLQQQQESLVVDCACGVGYAPVQRLNDMLQQLSPRCRKIVARNAPGEGPLNEGCGSEHVQKEVCPPKWYGNTHASSHYTASLDGDADRIVFFTELPHFALLDGDKIAVLICDFLQEQVSMLQGALQETGATLPPLKLGVVQTAYANGASTRYLQKVMDHVMIAKTGVKYVHQAAHENFDIGVYFEANGHGTVLFSGAFYHAMTEAHKVVPGHVALQRLCLMPSLVNQAVGDALSDLLLVDAILQLKQWDLETWNQLYTDLPSRQCKVKVQDRK